MNKDKIYFDDIDDMCPEVKEKEKEKEKEKGWRWYHWLNPVNIILLIAWWYYIKKKG